MTASITNSQEKEAKPASSRWSSFFSKTPPPPATGTIEDAALSPENSASFLSIVLFQWMTPLLSLGYARPLEASDLFKMSEDRGAQYIADRILGSYEKRQSEADAYNARLESGEISPGWRQIFWMFKGNKKFHEEKWRKNGRRKPSLVWSMSDAVFWWFWLGGFIKVIGDTAQVTSPLLVQALIKFAQRSYYGRMAGTSTPPVGTGIGLAFGLLALQVVASLCTHHFFYRSTSTGVLLRGGLIYAIFSRSLRLTTKSRSTLTNGKLVNHIGTDVSRIDFAAGFLHIAYAAPIQLAICLGLLIRSLGPSALAGFAVFIFAMPLQTWTMGHLFKLRKKSMVFTDKRAKLLQELLGGIKTIKLFSWEVPFLKRVFQYRRTEMNYIRSLLVLRAGNNAVALALPALAAVFAFVTYSLTGHELDPAVIFTSLSLFNLLRLPLMFLPTSFSAIADARSAVERLQDGVFSAELLDETRVTEANLTNAIEVSGASFSWDSPPPNVEQEKKKKKGVYEDKYAAALAQAKSAKAMADAEKQAQDSIFKLNDIEISVPRGQLVCIIGPVGSGKSSLLQGIIGEMRRTSGTVKFGGSVGYCSQVAWIQNATIRENICFGQPFEEARYWSVIKDSCLEPDLAVFTNGDMTEVGEKGISLSGGQKQRISIARTLYSARDIYLFDDPLSALDAHVGAAVFNNVLGNALAGKTRLLVTHALHFLPRAQVDYILVMGSDGRIAQRGTYSELMQQESFSRFMAEFGSQDREDESDEEVTNTKETGTKPVAASPATVGLMNVEERNIGAVSWDVYKTYINAGNGAVILPLLLVSLLLIQGSTVMASYWLVYWQEDKWSRPSSFYMGVYAGLGVSQALFFFAMGGTFALLTYFASQKLHQRAVERVIGTAPMSFFETTPIGRIMNRFSKDVDTIDNVLGDSLRMLSVTSCNIVGAIILISVILPWFLIAVICILGAYIWVANFYRASARELKRLDNILRSSVYSHFSESLSGIATVRAYGETARFLADNKRHVDNENRAYWLTLTNQRWLGIRIDFLGALLTFVVSVLGVGTRFVLLPSKTGLILSYILSIQQAFGWMVRQTAEVENNFSSVERLVYYATQIEQEVTKADAKPDSTWPSEGRIEIKDIVLSYRPELPSVLKGVSLSIQPGESIGIIGRTGAGKSSLLTALYRLVELTSGSIKIDGIDISTIALHDLRSKLAIIPQDPLLFSGTVRSNLDPFGIHKDVVLFDALRRACLVEAVGEKTQSFDLDDEKSASGEQTPVNRFHLDTIIEDEGGNLSLGQRSLVSLARALVLDARIVVLDEATAAIDMQTDQKIQDTLLHEFNDKTILVIAHRLKTIIGYDRICVLDQGEVAAFDTPSALFEQDTSIFRSMCDASSITFKDILAARERKENHQ